MQDISPSFQVLPAEQEIQLPASFQDQMSQMVGGFSASPSQLSQGQIQIQGVAQRMLIGNVTDYFTGSGVFIGLHSGAYKLSIGDPAADFLTWNGSTLNIGGSYITYAAGTYVVASVDTQAGTANGAFTKHREISLGAGSGALTIDFDLAVEGGVQTAHARVYRNGVAVGTDQSTSSGEPTFVTFSENIAGWAKNDLIQLYTWASGGKVAYVKNFRVKATTSLTPTVLLSA